MMMMAAKVRIIQGLPPERKAKKEKPDKPTVVKEWHVGTRTAATGGVWKRKVRFGRPKGGFL